jgi:hypothetical protein
MDPAAIMELLNNNPQMAQALASALRSRQKQTPGPLGAVADQPDSLIQSMADTYASPDIQKVLGQQAATGAKQIERGVQPRGAGVGPYNAYVAPHWTQNLNAAANEAKGLRQENGAEQQMMANALRKRDAAAEASAFVRDRAAADPSQDPIAFNQGGALVGAQAGGPLVSAGMMEKQSQDMEKLQNEALKRENTRYLLEKTLGSKRELAEGDWKLKRDQFMPFSSAGTPTSGIATTHRGTGEVTTQAPVLNPNKPAGGVGGVNPDDPKEIAQAIIEGRRSPLLNRMFRYAGPVAAELAKNHDYNHATAEQEWGAMTKFVASANNAQQLRIRQSIDAAYHQLDNIESIYGKWKEAGAASGIKVFNRAALAASRNLPGEAGVSAHMLEASINDMIEAVANVYMGGNSPTEQAFHLAEANLKSNWNPETFEAGLKLLRTNLKYRDNALKTAGPVGTGGQNQYAPDNTQSGNTAPAKVKKYNPATDSFE